MVLLSAPVIVLNSYRGIAITPRSLLEMSNAFMATGWQRVRKIVIPAGNGHPNESREYRMWSDCAGVDYRLRDL